MSAPRAAPLRAAPALRLILGAAAVAITLLPAGAHAAETGTSQNLFVRAGLDERWFVASRSNFATRDGTSDLFSGYVDLSLGRALSERWSGELGYRHAWLETARGWRDESRPFADLAWRNDRDGWRVSNRHRLEVRLFEGSTAEDRLRYRNETRVTLPERLSWGALRPFVEEELFYELDGSGLDLNWLTAGVSARIAKGLSFKLGYRWHAQKLGGAWSHRHVLVSGLVWLR